MRVLLAVLLVVGLVGCGSETEPPSPFSESEAKPPTAAVPPTPPESTQAKVENVVADTPQPKVDADPVTKPKPKSAPENKSKTDKPPAQAADADPIAALKKLGARINQNEQGEVVEVSLGNRKITDAGLVHLKGLVSLQDLSLAGPPVRDEGLAHLKGLKKLTVLPVPTPSVMPSRSCSIAARAARSFLESGSSGTCFSQKKCPHIAGTLCVRA